MTPFTRWIRKLAERYLDRWYEGPDAPARIRLMAVDYANRRPNATRAEWVEFAAGLGEECYRTGFLRGVDRTDREPDWRPDVPPEVLADWIDPTWREDGRGIHVSGAGVVPPTEAPTEDEIMKWQVDEILISTARSR